MSAPLEGMRVLDFTEGWAGPFCTMELGDLGADVVKVESPDGDLTRKLGPPFPGGESVPYLALNRNKRSIVLDLSTSAGVGVARRLAQESDVLVESFRPGSMDKMGLGYEALASECPSLVYASVTPFGQSGPYLDWEASELVLQAMLGLIGAQPEGQRVAWGGDTLSLFGGKFLLHGILAAYYHTRETGAGQKVDVAMLQAAMAMTMSDWPRLGEEQKAPSPAAPIWAGSDRSFSAADGRVEFNFRLRGYTPDDDAWEAFLGELAGPSMANDTRFRSEQDRAANFTDLRAELEPHLATVPVSELAEMVSERGGMFARWNDLRSAHEEEQARSLNMTMTVVHPLIGPLSMTASPYNFVHAPLDARRPPPTHGEHTIEVLREISLSTREILSLVEKRVI